MNRNQQLAAVIGLACLTEHRMDAEQRALLAWAWDSDRQHNTNTTTNRVRVRSDWQPQNLVAQVDATRVLEDGDKQVPLPKRWAETWERWHDELSTNAAVASVGGSAGDATHVAVRQPERDE